VVVELVGEHDLAGVNTLTRTLLQARGNVVVSLARTTFIDSAIVAVFFRVGCQMEQSGRRLIIHCPATSPACRVLTIVQAWQILAMTATLEEAIRLATETPPAEPSDPAPILSQGP
jgi:anti-anti-sigma regulatory factor